MATLPVTQVIHEILPLRSVNYTTPMRSITRSLPTLATLPRSISAIETNPDKQLTRKQEIAVEHFANGMARTQAEAARQAGYSESTAKAAATEIFAKPNVQRALQKRRRELFAHRDINSQDIINELFIRADANPLDYYKVTDDGSLELDLRNLTRDQAKAIKEFGHDALGRPTLVLHDSRTCWLDIAKLKGIGLIDRNAGNNLVEGPLTIEKLDALLAQSTTNNTQINIYNNTSPDKKELLPNRQVIEQKI